MKKQNIEQNQLDWIKHNFDLFWSIALDYGHDKLATRSDD